MAFFFQNPHTLIYPRNNTPFETNLQWGDKWPGKYVLQKLSKWVSLVSTSALRKKLEREWGKRSGPPLEKKSKKGKYNHSASHTKYVCRNVSHMHSGKAYCFLLHACIMSPSFLYLLIQASSLTHQSENYAHENIKFIPYFQNATIFHDWTKYMSCLKIKYYLMSEARKNDYQII